MVWAAISLLLAPTISDALRYYDLASTAFFWSLLVAAALIPLAHEFIHPLRPYRRTILLAGFASAALLAYIWEQDRSASDVYAIPLVWACILGCSDWLFLKAQPKIAAQPSPSKDVKRQLREHADNNITKALEEFDVNVADFKKAFSSEMPKGGPYVQFGSFSLIAIKNFNATKFGLEAAFAAFFIVFQRVYDDPRQSRVYLALREHALKKLSEIQFPDQNEKSTYLVEDDIQKVWEQVNNPKYRDKMEELRLAVIMLGLSVGPLAKPLLAEDKDREVLTRLMKRTLGRMRACFQQS